MKKLLTSILAALTLCGLLTLTPGCGTLDKAGVYQGDKALYDADLVIATSYDTVHTFVLWEYQNRALLASQPQIKDYANYLRLNYPTWHKAAISARNVYLAGKSKVDKDALEITLAVLRKAMTESQQWLANTTISPITTN